MWSKGREQNAHIAVNLAINLFYVAGGEKRQKLVTDVKTIFIKCATINAVSR